MKAGARLAAGPGLVQTPSMAPRSLRLILPVLFALALPACGFHLRAPLALPAGLQGVQVVASNPYSPLAQSLTRSLERAGFDVPEQRQEGLAVLRVLSENWDSQPISVDQFGRAQEYTLRYAAVFKLEGADGEVLVPQQVIELSRDYISLPENSVGSESEREILSRELQREMAAAVLRRIDAVNRVGAQDVPPASGR
jgi:LPS-assembly lipoprotein